MRNRIVWIALNAAALLCGCGDRPPANAPLQGPPVSSFEVVPLPPARAAIRVPRPFKLVHVYVALCDNRNQGIVPVPPALGDGQDPDNNLYWGAQYGVRTFFRRSPRWVEVKASAPDRPGVLERCAFRSRGLPREVVVVADAYDGARMEDALRDFLSAASGSMDATADVGTGANAIATRLGGASDLVCFVGHNGLMDKPLAEWPRRTGAAGPQGAVVLACRSRAFFLAPLREAGCPPLLTTTGLMAPEGYVLEAALSSWGNGDPPDKIRNAAAEAYARYQRIGRAAAARLFATEKEP